MRKSFVTPCLIALLGVVALSGCRRLQDSLNLKYWESGIWPAKLGNVIIKHKASVDIALYYREYCQDIQSMLSKGRCIAQPILDSIEGNDQAALIIKASVQNAAAGDVVDAQDIVGAIEKALNRPGRQCFHVRANGFSSNPLNWDTRDHGNDNCTDGQPWDYPGFTDDDSCSNCVAAPNYDFQHEFSLSPQPTSRPTNSCVRDANAYLCRLVQPHPQGHAYIVRDNQEFGNASSTVSDAEWLGSSWGYFVKKKNGKTFEGCTRVNVGYRDYQYQCAYETSNHWSRKVNDSTWRVYFNAAHNTWKSVSCGLELIKVFKGNGSANPQEMARKCDGVDW